MASREFLDALTGSTSSVIANALVYPLDVITTKVQVRNGLNSDSKNTSKSPIMANPPKTRWQLIMDIYRSKGILGFYVGLDLALLQTFWSNFAYFYLYSWIKKLYYKYKSKEKGIVIELLQGALAGALSRLLTTPISVLTTRMQARAASSTVGCRDISQDIIKKDGICGFWRGYKASLILTANPAITYGVFEYVKKILPPEFRSSPLHSFVIGAMTKSIATISTYPYILCKTRLQAGSQMGITESFQRIVEKEGVLGLYDGVNEQLSKSVLCQALLFALKDYFNSLYSWIPVNKTPDS